MTDQTAISLVKPTTEYRFHLKSGGKSITAQGINPGEALLWTGYRPTEVAWLETLGAGISPADYANR
jgi:hypothetical protein